MPKTVINNNGPPLDDYETLSLAGRYDRSYLLCTYTFQNSGTNDDVFYKRPTWNTNGLKQETMGGISETAPLFSPNPFTSSVEVVIPNAVRNLTDIVLEVYDIMGEKIFTIHGSDASLNKELSSLSTTLESGIYLFKISSPSEDQQWLQKMVKL